MIIYHQVIICVSFAFRVQTPFYVSLHVFMFFRRHCCSNNRIWMDKQITFKIYFTFLRHHTWTILFVSPADLPGRRRLRSSSSHQLLVPSFRLTTVGPRTFPVAASLLCNSLPSDIQSSPSLPVFHQRLKHSFFPQSFPSIALWLYCASVNFVILCYSSQAENFWRWHSAEYDNQSPVNLVANFPSFVNFFDPNLVFFTRAYAFTS